MKSLLKLRSFLFAFTVVVLAGCSGITETTLPDADSSSISSTDTEVLHQEVPDYIDNTENYQPTVLPPKDRYKDRE